MPSLIYESSLVSIQWLTNTGMSSSDIIQQWLAPSSSEQYVKSAIVQHLESLVDVACFFI